MALSTSAGALNLCSSTEEGVALKSSEALALKISAAFVGVALIISAEGVTDLIYSVCEVGGPGWGGAPPPGGPLRNMSADGVRDR